MIAVITTYVYVICCVYPYKGPEAILCILLFYPTSKHTDTKLKRLFLILPKIHGFQLLTLTMTFNPTFNLDLDQTLI